MSRAALKMLEGCRAWHESDSQMMQSEFEGKPFLFAGVSAHCAVHSFRRLERDARCEFGARDARMPLADDVRSGVIIFLSVAKWFW